LIQSKSFRIDYPAPFLHLNFDDLITKAEFLHFAYLRTVPEHLE
jgi:hypothetical protein